MNLDQITTEVLSSSRYRDVDPRFIRRVASIEMNRGRSHKDTVKAVKNKLHQVGGAYFPGETDEARLLEIIQSSAGDTLLLRDACQRIMALHASTKERLPILDRFYAEIFAGLPTPASVVDIACGLNPLAFSWMGLPHRVRYQAYDIYNNMIRFLNDYFQIAGINGQAILTDVIEFPLGDPSDLALVLKAIPCLEQVDKTAGMRLMKTINASRLVVSFPAKSLGGRSKGMIENYEAHFNEMLAPGQRVERRLEFPTELVFVVSNPIAGERV